MSDESDPISPLKSDDADWAEWENKFRDARPVLPAVALQRIEAAMHQAIDQRAVSGRPASRWLWWAGVIVILVVGAVICGWLFPELRPAWTHSKANATGVRIEERIPLPASERWLSAPARPIFPAGARPIDLLSQPPQPAVDPLPDTVESVVATQPDIPHLLGLLALRWTHGNPIVEADLIGVVLSKRGDRQASPLLVLLCWRALGDSKHQGELPKLLQSLHEAGCSDPWMTVFDLYAADATGTDAQVQQASALVLKPLGDPLANAQGAQLGVLDDAGFSKASAGLEVLTHQINSPWLALRELDQHLTARVERLKVNKLAGDATRLLAVRDMLRNNYLDATRARLVPQCAALEIAGNTPAAADLLRGARGIKYLNEPGDLAILLARLGEYRAWTQIINPLLTSETDFIRRPPDSANLQATTPASLTLSATGKHVEEGVVVYESNVAIAVGAIRLACDRAKLFRGEDGAVNMISASGSVQIEGIDHMKRIASDAADVDLSHWTVRLHGNVAATREDGASHPSADETISFDGRVMRP